MATYSPGSTPLRPDRELGSGSLSPLLQDWWEELLWPRIFGAARLGLRPGRLGLAFVAIVVAALLIEAGLAIDARLHAPTHPWPWEVPHRPDGFYSILWTAYIATPVSLLFRLPFTTLVVGPVLLALWTVLVGAISRMAACDIALGEPVSWVDGLKFAAARWWSLLGSILGPLVLAWGLAGGLVLAGLLARWPVANLSFAVCYGAALLLSFFAVLVLVIFILGKGMLIPAVVCEGADAIDAIQKAYRYVIARPGRTIWYLIVASAGLALVCGVFWLLICFTIGLAARATGTWSGQGYWMIWWPTTQVLNGLGVAADQPRDLTYPVGAGLIRLWTLVPALLFFASIVSCATAANTMIYLALRRICDGQDVAELWVPGMIAGSMAVSMHGRAAAARESGLLPASSASPPEYPDQ